MGIKERWYKKIQKNCFESELEYTYRKGNTHKETVLFKRSTMPLGVWGRVYPIYEESEDGTIKTKWINLIFGGWRNLIILIVILAIVGFALLQFSIDFNQIEYLRNIPCVQQYMNKSVIDISNFTLS